MRFCFILAGLLLGPVILANGANTLKLPEGAVHPEHLNHTTIHETKAQGLALVPPHRLDESLPKEKLSKQPLIARLIKVDKSIYNKGGLLQTRLSKLGYNMKTMKSWGDRESGKQATETFLLKAEQQRDAPLEDLTVSLHWVSTSKAILMISNAKGEYLALKDYKPFVKVFRGKKSKKAKTLPREV